MDLAAIWSSEGINKFLRRKEWDRNYVRNYDYYFVPLINSTAQPVEPFAIDPVK